MAKTTIDRIPGNCDFDVEEICKEIQFQNKTGNKLTAWTIESNTITLTFE